MEVTRATRVLSLLCLALPAACGGATSSTPDVPLTLRASVNGAAQTSVTSPNALNLPNIGDTGVVTAYEGDRQVSFSLASADCANVVAISPATSAMQQTVSAIKNGGECSATAQAADGSSATLTIFALPPP